MLVVNRREQ